MAQGCAPKGNPSGAGKPERRKRREGWKGSGAGVVLFRGLIHTTWHLGGDVKRGLGVRNGVVWLVRGPY